MHDRKTGVLAHISSLPCDYGIGDLGCCAHDFAHILSDSGVRAWQMLPTVPTEPGTSNSPYSSTSAFAGNSLFISPDRLIQEGLIEKKTADRFKLRPSQRIDYSKVYEIKESLLLSAYETFRAHDAYRVRFRRLSDDFWNFCVAEAYWLEDYALYSVLKKLEGGKGWNDWQDAYKFRDWSVLDTLKADHGIARMLDIKRFEQFLFHSQLQELISACRELDIEIIGDLPIYVAYDSADVWGHREFFDLDETGAPVTVAGVPPDYFSETGQRWGNPIYRWETMRQDNYGWWVNRVRHALRGADRVRIDHFRGFMGYWEIQAEEPTARNGVWKAGPGMDFFDALGKALPKSGDRCMPFIAEDLGVLTDDVVSAMEELSLPGMKVLQFAFGEGMPQNMYAPHNHVRNSVAYVGTHDNNTTIGWWRENATETEKDNLQRYIDRDDLNPRTAADSMIRMAMSSTSDLAVLTLQDILHLDSDARTNTPSTVVGNWEWKLEDLDGIKNESQRLRELSILYGRYAEAPLEKTAEITPDSKEEEP